MAAVATVMVVCIVLRHFGGTSSRKKEKLKRINRNWGIRIWTIHTMGAIDVRKSGVGNACDSCAHINIIRVHVFIVRQRKTTMNLQQRIIIIIIIIIVITGCMKLICIGLVPIHIYFEAPFELPQRPQKWQQQWQQFAEMLFTHCNGRRYDMPCTALILRISLFNPFQCERAYSFLCILTQPPPLETIQFWCLTSSTTKRTKFALWIP